MVLANLPAELLQRIASFCSGEDILRLSTVCRHLRSSCYDAVVLQSSFAFYAPEPIATHIQTHKDVIKLVNADLARRKSTSEKLVWVRLSTAVAARKALEDRLEILLESYASVALVNHPYPDASLLADVKEIVGVLATLTALGYPQVNNFATTAALTGFAGVMMESQFWAEEEPPLDLPFCSQLFFCLTTGLLGTNVLNNMFVLALRVDEHIAFRFGGQRVGHGAKLVSWFGHQIFAMLRQSVMIWIIQSSAEARARNDLPRLERLTYGRPNTTGGGDGMEIPLPLPLGSSPDPLRAAVSAFTVSDSWSDWLRGASQSLGKTLEEGEWYGYFTTGTSRSTVGSPMSNIKFVFDQHLSVEGVMKFHARNCEDNEGTFALEGRVYTDNLHELGNIFFRQHRMGITSWQYFGTVTPMGISGYWGGRDTSLGMFWLWRRDWMDPEATNLGLSQQAQ